MHRLPLSAIKLPKGKKRKGGKLCNPIKYSKTCEYSLQFDEYECIMNPSIKGEDFHGKENRVH